MDSYRDLVADLNATIASQANVIKRKDAEIAELKRVMLSSGDLVLPIGSDEDGWFCPVVGCWSDIEHPFEQRHCTGCGSRFEWSPGDWE